MIYNIPAEKSDLEEDVSKKERLTDGTLQGRNDTGRIGYLGPAPPPGKPHRYFFKLYALDIQLKLKPGAKKAGLEEAMRGHVLAEASLMGTYQR
ncbi:MAG: putative kinase inhibitor protein [candidate division TA06 bacterium ADurb.Bin417]|uniref:Putative kinase inhibitor protein n=1 Tax=candidate division TA06 bacterium ADurb.Bin417 TaxID=1852828 RepID=A0A1V5M618_UNCT6|nr:MAG: putative kinase inhibitor protein [candidate division TA06 bacterium ADurb.Bin417]